MSVPDTKITVYPDGPLLVRGPIDLRTEDGTEIATDRAVVALCRCGLSRIRPFCDGTHKKAGFNAGSGREDRGRPGGD
ncbi:MAG: CDGSH iron-sulfur domain-containing protein [Solirubrobacterales bacterium]